MSDFIRASYEAIFNKEAKRLIESKDLAELDKRKGEILRNYNRFEAQEIVYRAFLILFEEKKKRGSEFIMATSSIKKNVNISDSESAEKLIRTLEKSASTTYNNKKSFEKARKSIINKATSPQVGENADNHECIGSWYETGISAECDGIERNYVFCSLCKEEYIDEEKTMNYCPNCGAYMTNG